MPNPARQEILDAQLARQWAEWNKSCEVSSPEIQAAANFILAHTTPPTMADVEWDDDEHYLAEAEYPYHGRVIMLSEKDGWIKYFDERERKAYDVLARALTPTGKRYEIREISKPEHPETLITVEDYENAPSGTIVASNICPPYMKYELDSWTDNFGTTVSDEELAGGPTAVLRWGWYA